MFPSSFMSMRTNEEKDHYIRMTRQTKLATIIRNTTSFVAPDGYFC